ncbi:hypothetical protein GCM10017687_90830 [Streptomyces echinatus]
MMHIVSTVTGKVAAGRTAFDVLTACFPAGTLSGAPSPARCRSSTNLEPSRRGLYGGCVGYLDFAGDSDTAIAIRTDLLRDGTAHVQAGAGIVADSDPVAEDQECRNKAAAVLRAGTRRTAWGGRALLIATPGDASPGVQAIVDYVTAVPHPRSEAAATRPVGPARSLAVALLSGDARRGRDRCSATRPSAGRRAHPRPSAGATFPLTATAGSDDVTRRPSGPRHQWASPRSSPSSPHRAGPAASSSPGSSRCPVPDPPPRPS